jgi:hypothetical protein
MIMIMGMGMGIFPPKIAGFFHDLVDRAFFLL